MSKYFEIHCDGIECPDSKKEKCARYSTNRDVMVVQTIQGSYEGRGKGCRNFIKRDRMKRKDSITPTITTSIECTHDIFSTKIGPKICCMCGISL